MLTVKEVLRDKIDLDMECVDRVYLNGYVKYLQMAGGVINFIREQKHWPIPSPQMMKKIRLFQKNNRPKIPVIAEIEIIA